MSRRYEAIQEFFLGYFYPDWRLDVQTSAEVIEAFLNTSDPGLVGRVIKDLEELLGEALSEEQLHAKILREYSLYYDPRRDDLTMRAWLEEMLPQVRRDTLDI